ncbi:MAG TPA: ATP-dependent DNA helicase RecG [Marmoricola sp.]|nr:ATP-dependent DNA helicase RecG [Marmoricola sp.]
MAVGWGTRLATAVAGLAKPLVDHLGLQTVGELLEHYPRRYLDMDEISSTEELVAGELVTLVVQVGHAKVHPYQDKRTHRTAYRTEVQAHLGDADIWMTFFDRHSRAAHGRLEKQLTRARSVMLSGRPRTNSYKRGRWELIHPEITDVEDDPTKLMPVYPLSGKLSNQQVRKAVRIALDVVEEVPDVLPARLVEEHGLLAVTQALRWIHRPQDRRQAGAAAKRLKFDEAFVAQVALAQRRQERRQLRSRPRTGRPGGTFDAFDARMPFELTPGQRRVEEAVLADLAGDHPMQRLLQGEVGSGKTVVALRAMLRVVDSGAQAALLAPTEVLAQQHHRSITAMLGDLAEADRLGAATEATRVALLTGSLPAAARKEALLEAASGAAGIVVGTHALLEEQVQFAELGLVVVDEQHRFGVEQRAALSEKTGGLPPHELVMTATPIPRTVAMTVFGDLETSALTELPAGRRPIQTTVVPLADQPGWFDRVWARVREEVGRGHQVYVVCPRISEGDAETTDEPLDVEEDSRRPPAAVEAVAPALAEGALAGLRLAVLHGRLTPDEKERVMLAFTAGEIDVLVSTTVVEVGVDVGNATTMVLLDAERFGVSQLHQLRGRVGRGGHPGLCLLVTSAAPGSPARVRLEAVASTSDGFKLAELDLVLRREGDVLGRQQSGRRSSLRLLSVVRDVDVIEDARASATEVVERDPQLSENEQLRAAVGALARRAGTDYLDKA